MWFRRPNIRLKLAFESLSGDIFLPVHYNEAIQGLIYSIFSKSLAQYLHDEGFTYEKRHFKLFNFSRILEKGMITYDKSRLHFGKSISFYFSSPKEDIIEDFGNHSFKGLGFNLNANKIYLSQLDIMRMPVMHEQIKIKALSPITVYSTFVKDEKPFTHYYKPTEDPFSMLVESNLKKKFSILSSFSSDSLKIKISPVHFSALKNRSIIIFGNTPIEGYTGVYELSGSTELMMVAYDTGLGSKNSEGFGMWEIWEGGKNA